MAILANGIMARDMLGAGRLGAPVNRHVEALHGNYSAGLRGLSSRWGAVTAFIQRAPTIAYP